MAGTIDPFNPPVIHLAPARACHDRASQNTVLAMRGCTCPGQDSDAAGYGTASRGCDMVRSAGGMSPAPAARTGACRPCGGKQGPVAARGVQPAMLS